MREALLLYAWSLTLLVLGVAMAVGGLLLENKWHAHPVRQAFAKGLALIGELLCPIAIVSMIYEAHLRDMFLQDMRSSVDTSVRRTLLARNDADESFNFGFSKAHAGLGMDVLAKKALGAKNVRIEIPWFEDEGIWRRELPAFANDHRNISIFIADQNASWTKSRGVILARHDGDHDPNYGPGKARNALQILKHTLANDPNAHVYKMRDCMPSLLIVEYDDSAVIGFYLNSGHPVQKPQIDVQTTINGKRTPFGEMIVDEFTELEKCSDGVRLTE
jgi:hypothetical protein